MGEHAREDIMRRHGVDIGDDEPKRQSKVRCPTCGKLCSRFGVSMHHQDKHGTALLNLPTAQPLVPQLLPLFSDRYEYNTQVGLPASITPSDHLDFAPRIGVAWSPFGSEKTVIRSGYGIFFAYPDTNLLNHTVVTVPFSDNQTVFNDRPPVVPTTTPPRVRRSPCAST